MTPVPSAKDYGEADPAPMTPAGITCECSSTAEDCTRSLVSVSAHSNVRYRIERIAIVLHYISVS